MSVVLAYESHPLITIVRAIESKTHGNVLWAPLDHGATRIGYAYSADIAAKYPDGVTQEVAEKEAIEAMKVLNGKNQYGIKM